MGKELKLPNLLITKFNSTNFHERLFVLLCVKTGDRIEKFISKF